jgi:hypothetical protein
VPFRDTELRVCCLLADAGMVFELGRGRSAVTGGDRGDILETGPIERDGLASPLSGVLLCCGVRIYHPFPSYCQICHRSVRLPAPFAHTQVDLEHWS